MGSVHYSTVYERIVESAYDVKRNPTDKNWQILRALFTSYCLLFDIYTNDMECDDTLQHIADICNIDGANNEHFKEYMLFLIA